MVDKVAESPASVRPGSSELVVVNHWGFLRLAKM